MRSARRVLLTQFLGTWLCQAQPLVSGAVLSVVIPHFPMLTARDVCPPLTVSRASASLLQHKAAHDALPTHSHPEDLGQVAFLALELRHPQLVALPAILGALLVGECFSILALAMTVQQHTSQWCQQVVLGQDVRYAHPAPSLMP